MAEGVHASSSHSVTCCFSDRGPPAPQEGGNKWKSERGASVLSVPWRGSGYGNAGRPVDTASTVKGQHSRHAPANYRYDVGGSSPSLPRTVLFMLSHSCSDLGTVPGLCGDLRTCRPPQRPHVWRVSSSRAAVRSTVLSAFNKHAVSEQIL